MLFLRNILAPTVLAGCLLLGLNGCAGRVGVGYRAYDPYYRDYHVWVDPEPTYYHQWILETHRRDRDYRRLRRGEQREYWRWRHDHYPERH
jgi:hypothetical protein